MRISLLTAEREVEAASLRVNHKLEAGWQIQDKGLVWEMALVIELPPREDVLRFNRERWAEVVAD